MRAILTIAIFTLMIVTQGAWVMASEDAHQGDGHGEVASHGAQDINWIDFSNREPPPLVFMFVNFLIVAWLTYIILRKGLSERVSKRKSDLESALREAEDLKKEAKEAMAIANERSDALDLQMAKIRKDVLEAGKATGERIVKDAELRAERMKNESTAMVKQEIARLAEEVRGEIVEEVVKLAKEKISRRIDERDRERMAKRFLDSVEKSMDREQ